jgi:hypothetical protein
MAPRTRGILTKLESLRAQFGAEAEASKAELLQELDAIALPKAHDVLRLHETLCFIRAYPDSPRILELVRRMLCRFSERRDLRRHRDGLRNSGIAGTEIRFGFFCFTAEWLARRWSDKIRIDWPAFERKASLEKLLHLLVLYGETPALDEYALPVREWLDRFRGEETDAAFLIRRFQALRLDSFLREALYEELDVPIRLAPGPGTPSRTHAEHRRWPVVYQTAPLVRARPSFSEEVRRPPLAVRVVDRSEGLRLIALAREAMVTRSRDLDVFAHGDASDVRLVECGGGLQFALIGAIPERRLLLESVYGMLTLRNGVPVGYVLMSALFCSSEVAYNVFESFRGAEAAAIYARVLATIHHVFGSDCFTIYPYQLGHENEEAIRSGAWWFYQKLGFRPREKRVIATMEGELAATAARPSHRSSPATLRALARENVYWSLGRDRTDVIGELPIPNVGLHVSAYIAQRFGSDRERARRTCALEAARLLGLRSLSNLTRGERLAWVRWAPLVMLLPGAGGWSAPARRALIDVVKAKGGRRESDFVRAFDAHRDLRAAVVRLLRQPWPARRDRAAKARPGQDARP